MSYSNVVLDIDQEFEALCPPLLPEEERLLDESLIADGCRETIKAWSRGDHTITPAIIRYAAICTLGFSKENISHLLELLDSGQIEKLDFLFSIYFRSNERESCERSILCQPC